MRFLGLCVLRVSKVPRYSANGPGQIIPNRDENFGPPFYRTALSNNTVSKPYLFSEECHVEFLAFRTKVRY